MKTADFYIGLGEDAEWLGSLSADGTPAELDAVNLFGPTADGELYTEATFREIVAATLAKAVEADRGYDANDPWPWPYPSSHGTDYVYVFVNGTIHVFEKGFNAVDSIEGAFLTTLHYQNATRRPGRFPIMGATK